MYRKFGVDTAIFWDSFEKIGDLPENWVFCDPVVRKRSPKTKRNGLKVPFLLLIHQLKFFLALYAKYFLGPHRFFSRGGRIAPPPTFLTYQKSPLVVGLRFSKFSIIKSIFTVGLQQLPPHATVSFTNFLRYSEVFQDFLKQNIKCLRKYFRDFSS